MTAIYTQVFKRAPAVAAVAVLAGGIVWQTARPAADGGVAVPPAKATLHTTAHKPRTAVLAGGCFWGMEEVFQHVKGVTQVVSGYAGGSKAHANYADSSTGQYGDAESVRITYDPSKISYAGLLRIYFSVAHDPTEVNRQTPDVGSQYRSEIFAQNPDQARVAHAYIHQLDKAGVFDAPIATKVAQHQHFYAAEAYHQNYAEKHPDSLYLRLYDAPKVAALKTRFAQRYRAHPVNLASNG